MENKILKNIVFLLIISFIVFGFSVDSAFAARQFYYGESIAESSTSSTTYQDKATLTFTPDANSTYVIIASWLMKENNTSYAVKSKLIRTTGTAKDLNELMYRPKSTADYFTGGAVAVESFGASPGSQTYKIQFSSNNSSGTAYIKEAKIIVIKMTALDKYVVAEAKTTTTSTTYQDKAVLTFTPATAGDYIILNSATINGTWTTLDMRAYLCIDAVCCVDRMWVQPNGLDTNVSSGGYFFGAVKKETFSAASHTIKIQYATNSAANSVGMAHAYIVALRADEFSSVYYNQSDTRTTTNSTSFQNKLTLTATPTAGDYLVIGSQGLDMGPGGWSAFGRLTNGASIYGEARFAPKQPYSTAMDDQGYRFFSIKKETLSNVSTTWNLQYRSETSSYYAGSQYARLLVLGLSQPLVNGSCGTAAKTYLSTASSYGADTFCVTGTASPLSPVFPVGGTPTTWQCQGSGGGSTANCTAYKNRKPTITNGTISYSVLVNNKINFTGFSASDADGEALSYAWGCTDGGTFTNNLVPNPQYIAPATPRTDTCNLLVSDGMEVVYATVTVSVSDVIVNGSCGTASKAYPSGSSSYGLDTFCNPGIPSPLNPVFPVTGTPTTWQCQGSGGGTTAICTATLNAPLTSAISADNFKNPLEVANDLSSTEEECWYCDHYKNTSNVIVPAAGGAVGNIQFKFNYQGTTNLTGYQFAMSTGANPDLAVIKSDDWVNYSVAPGGTITVGSVKIGGITKNISVQKNAVESSGEIPYKSSLPYNWWIKVKNSGGEESAWIPATGHSYTPRSHHYPVVKIALRSIVNDLLACTTVASSGLVFNTADPCYTTCGAANVVTATDLENPTKWKCSICYDQTTNTPKPCAINSVAWELPSDAPVGFGLKTGSTLTTANPTFTGITSGQIIDNMRITISGSSCSIEGGLDSYTPLPLWIER